MTTRRRCLYPHNLLDLIFADGPVPIDVVQGEGPLQLLKRLPSGGEVQSDDVLLKVQSAVRVGVKAPEDMASVRCGVCVREEAGVDALKLLLADLPTGTLLQEGLVPRAELRLGVFSVGLEFLQEFL